MFLWQERTKSIKYENLLHIGLGFHDFVCHVFKYLILLSV